MGVGNGGRNGGVGGQLAVMLINHDLTNIHAFLLPEYVIMSETISDHHH